MEVVVRDADEWRAGVAEEVQGPIWWNSASAEKHFVPIFVPEFWNNFHQETRH
jgi:hypothetical protein